ncbi:hypothetical protein LCGC14_2358340 [marine sediment metagenome]|uniref:Uncharacterized protein n=1 Tax=marine sediment metagenome TaxID=412755 RepID=A0A0F9CUL7_9ZZZZ
MTQVDKNEREKVLMPCKRGTDRLTQGESCNGRSAFRLARGFTATAPAFKCCKCGFEWIVPTGGQSPV